MSHHCSWVSEPSPLTTGGEDTLSVAQDDPIDLHPLYGVAGGGADVDGDGTNTLATGHRKSRVLSGRSS
jgi:hypothetical protein